MPSFCQSWRTRLGPSPGSSRTSSRPGGKEAFRASSAEDFPAPTSSRITSAMEEPMPWIPARRSSAARVSRLSGWRSTTRAARWKARAL